MQRKKTGLRDTLSRLAGSPLRLAIAVFVLAVVARVVFVFVVGPALHMKLGPAAPTYTSNDGYAALAKSLLAGHGLRFLPDASPVLFRTPIYPALLAVFFHLTGGREIAVMITNTIFNSLGCALLAVVAWKVFGRTVAIITGVLTALHPHYLAYTWQLWTEPVQVFFVGLFALCLVFAFEKRTVGWGIASGFALGLAVLAKGFLTGFPLLLLPVFLLTRNAEGKRGVACAVLLCCAFALTLAPWTYRNYRVSGHFIPVNTGFGYVYLVGNGWAAEPDGGVMDNSATTARYEAMASEKGFATRPAGYLDFNWETDRFFMKLAVDELRANPFALVKKTLLGIPRTWYIASTKAKTLAAAVITVPLLILSVLGTGRIARRRLNFWPVLLPLIYTTFAFAVVQAHFRFSMPVSGLLISYAAASALLLIGRGDLVLDRSKPAEGSREKISG